MATTDRARSVADTAANGRRLGQQIGLEVALWFVAAATIGALVASMSDPGYLGPSLALVVGFGIPTLIAGWLGGRVLGPTAVRARSRRDWAIVVVVLAVVAVLIGDVGVAIAFAIPYGLPDALVIAPIVAAYGIIVVPLAAPVTLVAAWIWAYRMRRAIGSGHCAGISALASIPALASSLAAR